MKTEVTFGTPKPVSPRLKPSELTKGVYHPFSLKYREVAYHNTRIIVLRHGKDWLFVDQDGSVQYAAAHWFRDEEYEYERVSDDIVTITFTNNEK